MKKHFAQFIIILLFFVCFCSGCGIKKEKDLLTDLAKHPHYHVVDGTEITELSIIKRMTDKKNKSDTVYVSVQLDHEAAQEIRGYTMFYSKYNGGWVLENVDRYYGSEIPYDITPKKGPSTDFVIKELDEYNKNLFINNSYVYIYNMKPNDIFWEQLTISDMSSVNAVKPDMYRCAGYCTSATEIIAKTDSKSTYDTEKIIFMTFNFDTYTYEWNMSDIQILDYY